MGVVVFGREPKCGVVEVEVTVATATLSRSSLFNFLFSPKSMYFSDPSRLLVHLNMTLLIGLFFF